MKNCVLIVCYLTASHWKYLALSPRGVSQQSTVMPWMAKQCMHDWLSRMGMCTWQQLQTTFTGLHCMCIASWTHTWSDIWTDSKDVSFLFRWVLPCPPPPPHRDRPEEDTSGNNWTNQFFPLFGEFIWPTFYVPSVVQYPHPPGPECGAINKVDCVRQKFSDLTIMLQKHQTAAAWPQLSEFGTSNQCAAQLLWTNLYFCVQATCAFWSAGWLCF